MLSTRTSRASSPAVASPLPMLRESKGAIVNIASELGLVGAAGLVIYGAAKAGVIQLSRALAVEEGPNEIRVNCVCPGPVDTPFLIPPQAGDVEQERRGAASSTIVGRLGTAQENSRRRALRRLAEGVVHDRGPSWSSTVA